MKTSDILEMYIRAVNKIDDYFEYRNDSEVDRDRVHQILHELRDDLKVLQHFQENPSELERYMDGT